MLNALLSPTKILSFEMMSPEVFSAALRCLVREAGTRPRRLALVRDGRPSSEVDGLVAGLKASFDLIVLDRVRPDPLASDVTSMAAECDLHSLDAVIGLGGGSVMDSAKALAALAGNGGGLEDYLGPSPSRSIDRKGPPLVLVPTTAGTGSEVTKVGVYTSAAGRKYTLGSPKLQADAALLSGSLAASMPPALAASTGFDALSHAFESIWNKNAAPQSLEASTRAAAMVLEALPAFYAASKVLPGTAMESRNAISLRMLEAATSAGVAFSATGTALVHAISFVLSEDWHVPHGVACAFTLEDAYRLQSRDPEIRRRLEAVAAIALPDAAGRDSVALLLDRILELKRLMGLPASFRELGVDLKPAEVRGRFERAFSDPKMANSLPAAKAEEVYAFLEEKA